MTGPEGAAAHSSSHEPQSLAGEAFPCDTVRSVAGVDPVLARKQAVREQAWEALKESGEERFPGAWGRIPNFAGAEQAAARLASLPEWKEAAVVKANPDAPQLPVRARALAEGKLLYMAVPRLAAPRPFLQLGASDAGYPRQAASIRGAQRFGKPVTVAEMRRIDLVVCGTVAVNAQGVRVGKGGGFSDLEFGLLTDAGLVDERTVLVTTVHQVQLVEADLPETDHDFRVDLVVTPSMVLRTGPRRRPAGILWDHLTADKIDAIPVLRDLHGTG